MFSFWVIFLFLYVYNPMFSFIPVDVSLILVLLISTLIPYRLGVLWKVWTNKFVLSAIILLLVAVVYSIMATILSGHNVVGLGHPYFVIRIGFELFVFCPIVINEMSKNFKHNIEFKFFRVVMYIAVTQAVTVLLMLLSPDIRTFVFETLLSLREGHDKVTQIGAFIFRGYGISSGHLFGMPMFHAFACLVIFYLSTFNRKYIFLLPIVILPILVNARVGLIFIPIFVIVFIIFKYYDFKEIGQKALIFVMFFFGAVLFFQALVLYNEAFSFLINWLATTITPSPDRGVGSSQTLVALIERHIHYPDSFMYIFMGNGEYIFANPQSSVRSDIGYIQYLYHGGLLFSTFIYASFIILFLYAFSKTNTKGEKMLVLGIFMLLFLSHAKGNVFTPNVFMRSIMLFLMLYIMRVPIALQKYSSRNQEELRVGI